MNREREKLELGPCTASGKRESLSEYYIEVKYDNSKINERKCSVVLMAHSKHWGEELSKMSDQTAKEIPKLRDLLVYIHKCLLVSCICVFSIVIFLFFFILSI